MSKNNKGAKKKEKLNGGSTVARNRKAHFDFKLGKEIIAGIQLEGTEVKSLRLGNIQLKGSYAKIIDDEVWAFNCVIAEYNHGNRYNHDPIRAKKLLLKRYEIQRLEQEIKLKNVTLVPSKVFFKGNYAKIALHIAEGKTKGDKRDTLKKKDQNLDIARAIKNY